MIYVAYTYSDRTQQARSILTGYGYVITKAPAPKNNEDIQNLVSTIKDVNNMAADVGVVILSWQKMEEEYRLIPQLAPELARLEAQLEE